MNIFNSFNALKVVTPIRNRERFKVILSKNTIDVSYEQSPGVYLGTLIKCESNQDIMYVSYLVHEYLHVSSGGYSHNPKIKSAKWKVENKYRYVFTQLTNLIKQIELEDKI